MKIKHLFQPEDSKLCGQTVIAMLTNTSIEDACAVMEEWGGTRNPNMYRALEHHGFTYRHKINSKWDKLPEVAIVKFGYFDNPASHWTLKVGEVFYDPFFGVTDYEGFREQLKLMSYIEVYPGGLKVKICNA